MMSASHDLSGLYHLFQSSLDPTAAIRQHAEAQLKEASILPGFASALLELIMNSSSAASGHLDQGIKQAAAVFLKNHIEKHWETYDEKKPSVISEADKQIIRNSIIEAIKKSPEGIQSQQIAIIHRIVRSDFPDKWPNVLDMVVSCLQEQLVRLQQSSSLIFQSPPQIREIQVVLRVFHELVAWKGHNNEQITLFIQEQVFPIVLGIAQISIHDLRGYVLVKHALKSYFSAIQFKFSTTLMSGNVLTKWFTLLSQVFQIPSPSSQPDEEDSTAATTDPVWKMKKWAMHIHNKIFSRYGNSKLDSYSVTEGNGDFSKAYMTGACASVVQLYLDQIGLFIQGKNNLPDRLFCLVCDFLEATFRDKRTWQLIAPHIDTIIRLFVFPRLCFTDKDAELWDDDPCEFIRIKLDPFDDFYSGASSALNLIVDLVKQRKKTVLVPILGFINELLGQSTGAPGESNEAATLLQRKKDGALYMIGSLSTILLSDKHLKGQVESIIGTFILPELQAGTMTPGHLKLRACWVIEQFDNLSYQNPNILMAILQSVLVSLQDKELPVRVAACLALGSLLDNPLVQQSLPAVLPNVVESILTCANEIELDSLSFVLERLVEMFADEMAPYAQQLCVRLRDTLLRSLDGYKKTSGQEETENVGFFEDTDKMMAALGLLTTISTLLDAMQKNPEAMMHLEMELLPLIHKILQEEIMDVYEECFELVDTLVYSRKTVSPEMWQIYDLLCTVVMGKVGPTYLVDLGRTFDNILSYGMDSINENRLTMILSIIRIVMTQSNHGVEEDNQYTESDRIVICRIIETLLLYGRGKLDSVVTSLVDLVLPFLVEKHGAQVESVEENEPSISTDASLVYHLEVIINALYYNPLITLQHLEARGVTSVLMSLWVPAREKFTRVHDKRLVIIALSSLLTNVSLSSLPDSLKPLSNLITIYYDAVTTLPKALEERKKVIEAFEHDSDSDESKDFEFDDDDEVSDNDDGTGFDNNEPSSHAEARARRLTNMNSFSQDEDDYDYDDDDDDYYDESGELEEEPLFETPLDKIDIVPVIQNTMRLVCSNPHEVLQKSGIGQSHQLLVESMLK